MVGLGECHGVSPLQYCKLVICSVVFDMYCRLLLARHVSELCDRILPLWLASLGYGLKYHRSYTVRLSGGPAHSILHNKPSYRDQFLFITPLLLCLLLPQIVSDSDHRLCKMSGTGEER